VADYVKAASKAEVAPGTAKKIEIGGREIALFNLSGNFYAIDDFCPHRGGPLSEGEVAGNVVTCPWHGWEFDVSTGQTPENPQAKVGCYRVKVKGEDVFLSVQRTE